MSERTCTFYNLYEYILNDFFISDDPMPVVTVTNETKERVKK